MDACYQDAKGLLQATGDMASELEAWFMVSGDMDDFIYYGEDANAHSER